MKNIIFIVVGTALLVGCSPAANVEPLVDGDVKSAENTIGKSDEKAEDRTDKMKGAKLTALVKKIDKEAKAEGNSVAFKVKERALFLVYDESADRMRIVAPIIEAANVPPEIYLRLLQANYDAALDARYAIGNKIVWSVFIHPLSTLTADDFISGIVQTVTAADTFGTSYTSGAFVFGGGDSSALHEDLLKELEEATKSKDTDI